MSLAPTVSAPKTLRSWRTVPMAGSTAEIVRRLVQAAGVGLVVTLKRGGPMRSGATYNRAGEPTWKKTGVPRERWARIQDRRHTHASWMIEGGMDLFQLSYRLGHQSTLTTDGRYAHLVSSSQQTSATIAALALAR